MLGSTFNFSEDHIMIINNVPYYWIPKFLAFYSIFITSEDTFLYFIDQLAPFLLWNMHIIITEKIGEVQERASY
jgi:hypothetical protein